MTFPLPGNNFAETYDEYQQSEDRQIETAIMALASEVRTANLLTFMQWVRAQGDIDGSTKLHTKIVERLGLRDD